MMFMCFNTSHVVVYQDVRGQDVNNPLSFNTSHVVVYRIIFTFLRNSKLCFNTSHVVVYPWGTKSYIYKNLFQYISCCSLSADFLIKFLLYKCFNTSHVVVYQSHGLDTSTGRHVSIHLML